MSDRVERLKAELELALLEEELSAAKGKGKIPKEVPEELSHRVRAARQSFRNKYREQVSVNPASLGAGTSVGAAKGTS